MICHDHKTLNLGRLLELPTKVVSRLGQITPRKTVITLGTGEKPSKTPDSKDDWKQPQRKSEGCGYVKK